MRTVLGMLCLAYGIALSGVGGYVFWTSWLVVPWGLANSENLLLATFLTAVLVIAGAIVLVAGACGLLAGQRWSMRLMNRASVVIVLALLCHVSLLVLIEALNETEDPIRWLLALHWGLALALSSVPLVAVWWTGKYMDVPLEKLSWVWQQNQRRGRRMSGLCHHCDAPLNFATGEGVVSKAQDPFKLFCGECQGELSLPDAK